MPINEGLVSVHSVAVKKNEVALNIMIWSKLYKRVKQSSKLLFVLLKLHTYILKYSSVYSEQRKGSEGTEGRFSRTHPLVPFEFCTFVHILILFLLLIQKVDFKIYISSH